MGGQIAIHSGATRLVKFMKTSAFADSFMCAHFQVAEPWALRSDH